MLLTNSMENHNRNLSLKEIEPNLFYGANKYQPLLSKRNIILPTQNSEKFRKLRGPSTIWKIFKKQNDLINFINQSNCGLIPFTFQTEAGRRMFLAAHLETFWYYDNQRDMKDRNSYEIIQEFKSSKLYFDLEFDSSINENCEGPKITENFIIIVCFALKCKYGIICGIEDVLNLDSSTKSKYSCHLIFQLGNMVFSDNYNVGCFVKQLCYEIKLWTGRNEGEKTFLLLPTLPLPLESMEEFFIIDSKGNEKLFCDESVYSKNRHFRVYKSSKFGKNIPLLLNKENKFLISQSSLDKDEKIFLSSLVTYFQFEPCQFLKFPINEFHFSSRIACNTIRTKNVISNSNRSSISEIDEFINSVVHPGKIWRTTFFKENGTILYDIIGNRYCSNIGRSHKSNNVKYVVDLGSLTYYQKCYDPDCATFRSSKKKLPVKESFFINNNIDDDLIASAEEHCALGNFSDVMFSQNVSEEEIIRVAEQCESSFTKETSLSDSDEREMIEIANCCELFSQIGNSATFSEGVNEEYMTEIANQCESVMEYDLSEDFELK